MDGRSKSYKGNFIQGALQKASTSVTPQQHVACAKTTDSGFGLCQRRGTNWWDMAIPISVYCCAVYALSRMMNQNWVKCSEVIHQYQKMKLTTAETLLSIWQWCSWVPSTLWWICFHHWFLSIFKFYHRFFRISLWPDTAHDTVNYTRLHNISNYIFEADPIWYRWDAHKEPSLFNIF